jgi:hypothetical protein
LAPERLPPQKSNAAEPVAESTKAPLLVNRDSAPGIRAAGSLPGIEGQVS